MSSSTWSLFLSYFKHIREKNQTYVSFPRSLLSFPTREKAQVFLVSNIKNIINTVTQGMKGMSVTLLSRLPGQSVGKTAIQLLSLDTKEKAEGALLSFRQAAALFIGLH